MGSDPILSVEPAVRVEALERLIKTRRSIRRYQDRPVSTEMLLKAIEIAAWSASSGGKQGWMFYVVQDSAVIARIADAVEHKTEVMAAWPEAEPYRADIERWRRNDGFFRFAPACIAVTMFDYRSAADKVMQARGEGDEVAREMMAARRLGASRLQTVAGAVAYLLLVLHQMGLGACWMAGPLQAKRELETILKVPADQDFVALVPVGWPDEQPQPPSHKALAEMVRIVGAPQ